jgi:cytochrome oxidase assembly protein ShyY1
MSILNQLKKFSSLFKLLILVVTISFMLLSKWQYDKYLYKVYSNIFNYNLTSEKKHFIDNKNFGTRIKIDLNCKNQYHFILGNQIFGKKLGYDLHTVCVLKNKSSLVLVFRGWIYKNTINKFIKLPNHIRIIGLRYEPILPFNISKYSDQMEKLNSVLLVQRLSKEVIGKSKYILHIHNNLNLNNNNFLKIESKNKYIYNNKTTKNNDIKPIRHFFYSIQWIFFSFTSFLFMVYLFLDKNEYKTKINKAGKK